MKEMRVGVRDDDTRKVGEPCKICWRWAVKETRM